jgi:hypothetical protein
MVQHLFGRKAIVISDNELLFKVIELNLHGGLGLEIVGQGWRETADLAGQADLIVVALSSPASEPVVTLAEASLAEWIGRIPLLIISDRPFLPPSTNKIVHLAFPFAPGELQQSVEAIFQDRDSRVRSASECG